MAENPSKITRNSRRRSKKPKIRIKQHNLTILVVFSILTLLIYSSATALILKDSLISKNQKQSVSRALTDVIRKLFIDTNMKFDIIVYGTRTPHIDQTINEVTKEISSQFAVNLRHIPIIDEWCHEFNHSAVILTESEENLIKLHSRSLLNQDNDRIIPRLITEIPEKFKFIVYTEEVKNFDKIDKIISAENKTIIISLPYLSFFEFFIVNSQKVVNFAANLLYSDDHCGFFRSKLLNSFIKATQKWEKKLENFDHFRNFHGCVVSFFLYQDPLFYSDFGIDKNQNKEEIKNDLVYVPSKIKNFHGIVKQLLTVVAQRNNFSMNFAMYQNKPEFMEMYVTNNFITKEAIFISFGSKQLESSFMHHSAGFLERHYYYVVTPNDLYNNYEKLTFAFDKVTWVLIVFTFGLTFGIIAGLYMGPRWIRIIIFGRGINNPAFNALGTFFGIAQLRLPHEDFNRFILIFYIWFCLIIRTCYQSKMFEFLTSDMRKPLPESIEDLVKWNYTIVLIHTDLYEFENVNDEIINGREKPNILVVPKGIFNFLYSKGLNKKLKERFAFLTLSQMTSRYNLMSNNSLSIMKQEEVSKSVGLQLSMNNIMLNPLNHVLNQLIPFGIPKHLVEYAYWLMNRPVDREVEDPRRVLTMKILEFGFVLWFIACFVSFLVFLCECRSLWMKRQLRKLIGLIDFLRVLWHRLQDYHDRF